VIKSTCDNWSKRAVNNVISSFIHPPYLLERELVLCIQQLDEEKAQETLRKINSQERANLSDSPLRSVKNSLICSCTLYTRAVIEVGVNSETAFNVSDYYINRIEESKSYIQAENIEYEMLLDFIRLLRKYKNFSYNPLINKAINFITNNIQQKLTLNKIADYLKIHPCYLSAVFKKEVGINISVYINNHKAEAIKILLEMTNVKLTDIAYTFDFNNIQQFSVYFKKYYGISPLKYRKSHSTLN
jgi:two-component system response regulator YesN